MTRPQNPETPKDEERWEERFCPECSGRHWARVRPAYQFYPGDEERDTDLRIVGVAAYGLWKRMLNHMHVAVPRGWLVGTNGKPIEVGDLARLVGEPPSVVKKLLSKLEEHGVFSRTHEGIIYSRRMVRDEHISNVRAASGKRGGNPKLLNQHGEESLSKAPDLVNHPSKQNGKQIPTPAAAAAVAVSRTSNSGKAESAAPPAVPPVFANFTANVLEFCLRFYSDATRKRQTDVAEQLRDVLTSRGAKLSKTEIVRNQSPDRRDAKCREVLEEGVRDPDKAIVIVLRKLGDTSDDSPTDRTATEERRREREDDRAGRAAYAPALAWARGNPEIEAAINRQLNDDNVGVLGREEMFKVYALREYQRVQSSPGAVA